MSNKQIDIISVGETLIDFIGTQPETPFEDTRDFHRYLGGSPTNVAVNIARLGGNSALVASVGKDGLGKYIKRRLNEAGVNIEYLGERESHPTTGIMVNRTTGTPEFIAYRGADCQIEPEQLPDDLLASAKILHTTCFGLSKQPARNSILVAARRAAKLGLEVSIDLNYSEKIWPLREEAVASVSEYCHHGALVKVSQDDSDRLFGPGLDHEQIFERLHMMGAKKVCLTLGKEGAKLSSKGNPIIELKALPLDKIMDATGAGDAFWSGFLFAYLQQHNDQKCMETGLKMAAIKLQHVGRVPDYASALSEILNN